MAKKKVYLAGPMSGYEDWNFPAFYKAAKLLRDKGYHVFSPAEIDNIFFEGRDDINKQYKENFKEAYKKCLRVDFDYIMDHADVIALLPGWEASRGAQAEMALAKCMDLEVIYLD